MNILSRDYISSELLPTPGSPPSSPERSHSRSASTVSSFDRIPPVMIAQGNTPAPSDDHSDMVAHSADIVLQDDDEHHDYHRSHSNDSRPSTPPVPPTTVTALAHPSFSSTTTHPSTFSQPDTALSSTVPSSSAPSPSQSPHHSDHHHSHSLSPFSFFSHSHNGDSPKPLRIELTHPEVVLMNGQATVLEGVVYLTLHKNTKVKTLHLEFSGRSSVTWVDGKCRRCAESLLILIAQ